MAKDKTYAGGKPKAGHCGMHRDKLNTLAKVRQNNKKPKNRAYRDIQAIGFSSFV